VIAAELFGCAQLTLIIRRITMRLDKNAAGLLALTLLTLGVVATARAGEIPPAAQEMAKTYGLDAFGQIEGIRYTWNAEYPGAVKTFDGGSGTIKVSRTWEWDPKTGTVSFEGKDNNGQPLKVTYQRSQLGDPMRRRCIE
jgi:hypothetical protein